MRFSKGDFLDKLRIFAPVWKKVTFFGSRNHIVKNFNHPNTAQKNVLIYSLFSVRLSFRFLDAFKLQRVVITVIPSFCPL